MVFERNPIKRLPDLIARFKAEKIAVAMPGEGNNLKTQVADGGVDLFGAHYVSFLRQLCPPVNRNCKIIHAKTKAVCSSISADAS